MEGKKRFIFLGLCIGVMLGSSYIMFLAFNKAVGDPFLTVLVIVWLFGLLDLLVFGFDSGDGDGQAKFQTDTFNNF